MIGTMPRISNMTTDSVPFIEHALTPTVRVLFSQRRNIDTDNPYSGFNACDYTGDSPEHVLSCRHLLCRHLNISINRLIMPRQSHSLNIAVVDPVPIAPTEIENVDALITTLPNTAIAVNTADCLPLLFADSQTGIIAAAHSGWRGTVGKIAALTIQEMRRLGSEHENIKVIIGPSICPDCFEVGEEVAQQFAYAFPHHNGIILRQYAKPHIDLRKACHITLIEAGVKPENITHSGICSRCNHDTYFSARHLGIASGRTLSTIINQPILLRRST